MARRALVGGCMIRNFILDWSGTVADDLGAVITATNRVLAHYGKPPFTREQFREVFQLPYTEFYRHILPDVPLRDLQALYLEHFPQEDQQAVPLIEHALEFLQTARAAGCRLFVCSSAPEEHVRAQALANGVEGFFEHLHGGIIDKCVFVHDLLRQHSLLPQETAFVGDMRHDILAGHAAGLMSIATATGYESVSTLLTADPDLLVRNLSALTRLMRSANDTVTP